MGLSVHGRPVGRPSPLPQHDEYIRLFVALKCSDSQIATILGGTSAEAVRLYRKRQGIPNARASGGQPGHLNAAWKGGQTTDKDGYILTLRPDHPCANSSGYVREHRLVMESLLGRYLLPDEVVHHEDDDHANNAPSNLRVYRTNADHLAETLAGKVPQWTPEGLARIRERHQRGLGGQPRDPRGRLRSGSASPPASGSGAAS